MDQFFAIKVNRDDENPFVDGPSCLVWTLTDALRTAIRNAQASIKAGACSLFEMDATFRAPAHALLSEDEWAEVSADSARPLTTDLSVGQQRVIVTDGLIRLAGRGHSSGAKIESIAVLIDFILGEDSPVQSETAPWIARAETELRDALRLLDDTTAAEGNEDAMGQAELAIQRALEAISGKPEQLPRHSRLPSVPSVPRPAVAGKGPFEIAAHFVGDGESDGASPGCVRVTDPAFLVEALQALSKVCVSNALQFVALDGEVLAEWGKFGTDAVDGEQMSGILLLVYREHFMFTGESGDGRCESDMVSIKEFVAGVAASPAS